MSRQSPDPSRIDPSIVEQCRGIRSRLERNRSRVPWVIVVAAVMLGLALYAVWNGRGILPIDEERMLVAPPEESIQVLDPTCSKTSDGSNRIQAAFKNDSPYLVLRLDVVVVTSPGGIDDGRLAQTEHTFIFSPGLKPNQVGQLRIDIADECVGLCLERADLECWIQPIRIHVCDLEGREQIAQLNGAPTRVVRDWVAPTRIAGPSF